MPATDTKPMPRLLVLLREDQIAELDQMAARIGSRRVTLIREAVDQLLMKERRRLRREERG